ncbi:electron transfer flavoprotein subunit alpha/FixB family protein [Paucilactobacillus suebicus]|uniref:Electron transfer flavoprotein subunit alpha n=1 Tax=Paucilactobacillus suebicus DSM 5007 = KCTC 3549 TaxID=1423807 RepID=A0A0R1W649_9LACO|nr:electron transfer flavoprotein subunit alpha/FixB family protein [Paucilactobacillus suebicus]KRM13127.1 electron transfer flavoprotein subunit alpha [Paucilactobacillus suebicus DSM 5007 = KCTC 3549]
MTQTEIWVYVQTNQTSVEPTSLQLITKAKEIAVNQRVVAVMPTVVSEKLINEVQEYGPDKIITLEDDRFKTATDTEIADVLYQVVSTRKPNSLLIPATVIGRSVAPRLQAMLQTGLTADCLDVYFDGDTLVQVKPTYGDDIMCEITCPDHQPQMATVRPNVFKAVKQNNDTTIEKADFEFHPETQVKASTPQSIISSAANIGDANVVVALGRGASSPAIIEKARKLAAKLGGMVGVSRPLTDSDEFGHESQIGQSGQSIAPDLLINFGISGAVQYLVGIENAKTIVSVNTDPDAPILAASDYAFVGDANDFMDNLLEQVR